MSRARADLHSEYVFNVLSMQSPAQARVAVLCGVMGAVSVHACLCTMYTCVRMRMYASALFDLCVCVCSCVHSCAVVFRSMNLDMCLRGPRVSACPPCLCVRVRLCDVIYGVCFCL